MASFVSVAPVVRLHSGRVRHADARRHPISCLPSTADVVIVGAGIAGLSAARVLSKSTRQLRVAILEADDDVGGRVRSDVVDGFTLDRGFQVFIESYPELRWLLSEDDRRALDLRPFNPGATVVSSGGSSFHRVADPVRQPLELISTLQSPVGTLVDKLRVGALRLAAPFMTLEDIFKQGVQEKDTESYLRDDVGLTQNIIDGFFRPFYQGIFLAPLELQSSKMFRFLFKMFATGDASLPREGIGALPRQIAKRLPADTTIHVKTRAVSVNGTTVTTQSNHTISASAVIFATDPPSTVKLLEGNPTLRAAVTPSQPARGSTTLYFSRPDDPANPRPGPLTVPTLLLNGESDGTLINNMICISAVVPNFAPIGWSLMSVTLLGCPPQNDEELECEIRLQLNSWFGGDEIEKWTWLRTYRIPYSQPGQEPPNEEGFDKEPRAAPGVYVCGDYRSTSTLNGAIKSGRLAGEALLSDKGIY